MYKCLTTIAFVLVLTAMPQPISYVHAAENHERAAKAGLIPHKAVYDISMTEMHSGSQVVNVKGKMAYTWYPDCDGWVSSHQFDVVYEYADAPAVHMKSDFSTFESFNGEEFSFSSTRTKDGIPVQTIQGNAVSPKDKEGQANYLKPDTLEFSLPQGTEFPIAHTLDIIEAWDSPVPFYNTVIFDGSDEEGPVEVNAFISKNIISASDTPALENVDKDLLQSPARKVRLAFFPLENEDEGAPDYEMDVILHKNGVISAMNVEYDSFTLEQNLLSLEKEVSSCTQYKAPS